MSAFVIGLDFGTGSARAVLADISDGKLLADAEIGLDTQTARTDPLVARQSPTQYLDALEAVLKQVLENAAGKNPTFNPAQVLAVGIDATGSTPIPIDSQNRALGSLPEFADNPNAQAWLWKDHTAGDEAERFTRAAANREDGMLEQCGGSYSSEWFWAKIWRCLNIDRDVFDAAYSWVECCDWLASQLAGIGDPAAIARGACAAGHKALFNKSWGGLPPADFLESLEPELARLRDRLFDDVYAIGESAGKLSNTWAQRTGLPAGIPISVANLDAHAGAVGAGVGAGKLVKIMGTSTCDCALQAADASSTIHGISGIAADSIVPGSYGIEAGQSAVGDIFAWFVDTICKGDSNLHAVLSEEMAHLRPGESGLIALDWHNGNRCVLADPDLRGHLFGLSLHTTRAEIYRAWVEATAFGARMILDTLRDGGVQVDTIVCCGGIAAKNATLMQIYADITACTLEVSDSSQTCAQGSAIAAAVAAGHYSDIPSAQAVMAAEATTTFVPERHATAVYDRLYRIYQVLHDAIGKSVPCDMATVLQDVRELSVAARVENVGR